MVTIKAVKIEYFCNNDSSQCSVNFYRTSRPNPPPPKKKILFNNSNKCPSEPLLSEGKSCLRQKLFQPPQKLISSLSESIPVIHRQLANYLNFGHVHRRIKLVPFRTKTDPFLCPRPRFLAFRKFSSSCREASRREYQKSDERGAPRIQ